MKSSKGILSLIFIRVEGFNIPPFRALLRVLNPEYKYPRRNNIPRCSAAGLLILTIAISACAQKYDAEGDFTAVLIDGGRSVVITEYVGSKWDIRIPPRIQKLPVTGIGENAFLKKDLITISIPGSITSIGEGAFSNNQLTSVTIPSSVVSIGEGAFANNQLTCVIIPNSVTSIGDVAFAGNQLTSVTIGANVKISEGTVNTDNGFILIDSFSTNGFVSAYNICGKAAGTYTRPDADSKIWTRTISANGSSAVIRQ